MCPESGRKPTFAFLAHRGAPSDRAYAEMEMGRPKDASITAAIELALVVDRGAERLKSVGPSPLFDPPLRTRADGTVLMPGEPGGWVATNRPGRGPVTSVMFSPYLITDLDDPDFGMPAFTAMATRMLVAEELLVSVARSDELARAVERYPRTPIAKDAERLRLRHANLGDALPRVACLDDHRCLDDDEVFWRLRESLIARASSYVGVTETRVRSRALDRLRPGRRRRPRVKSERAVWVGHAHAAACLLGLYGSTVDAYERARRERTRNPP